MILFSLNSLLIVNVLQNDKLAITVKYTFFFGWLFGFYGTSSFVGYLMRNPLYTNKQFYFKQSDEALAHSSILKKHFCFKLFSLIKQFLFKKFSEV